MCIVPWWSSVACQRCQRKRRIMNEALSLTKEKNLSLLASGQAVNLFNCGLKHWINNKWVVNIIFTWIMLKYITVSATEEILHRDYKGKGAFPPVESSSCPTSERCFLNHVARCFDLAKKAASELLRSFWVSFSDFNKSWLVGLVLFYFFF